MLHLSLLYARSPPPGCAGAAHPATSALGLALKSYFYSAAVYGAVGAAALANLLRFEVLGPLLAIAVLLLLARLMWSDRLRQCGGNRQAEHPKPPEGA
jgi:hypothetical protein